MCKMIIVVFTWIPVHCLFISYNCAVAEKGLSRESEEKVARQQETASKERSNEITSIL